VLGELAVVNGETVKKGDEIAGVRVEEISDSYVKFSFKDEAFIVKVGGGGRATAVSK